MAIRGTAAQFGDYSGRSVYTDIMYLLRAQQLQRGKL